MRLRTASFVIALTVAVLSAGVGARAIEPVDCKRLDRRPLSRIHAVGRPDQQATLSASLATYLREKPRLKRFSSTFSKPDTVMRGSFARSLRMMRWNSPSTGGSTIMYQLVT